MLNKLRQWFQRDDTFDTGYVHDDAFEQDERSLKYDPGVFGGVNPPDEFFVEEDDWTMNQGATSSCTCFGMAHCVAMIAGLKVSPRYAFTRIKHDDAYKSSQLGWGAYTTDCMKLMQKEGICDYDLAPNTQTHSDAAFTSLQITDEMRASAEKNKGGAYMIVAPRMGSQQERFEKIKEFLYTEKRPCVVGVSWHREYNRAYNPTGIIPYKRYTSRAPGHIVAAVGYTKLNGHDYLVCENSYGESWGDKGRVWIPVGPSDIHSAYAFLPKERSDDLGYVVPELPVPKEERNAPRERANWYDFEQNWIGLHFPLDVQEDAAQANREARAMIQKEKLLITYALTYLGYTPTDMKNHYYARSRNKVDTSAYKMDLTKPKKR